MLEALQTLPFLHTLEGIRTSFLTLLMEFITLFGQEVLPVAVICALFWCINKKTGYKFVFVFFCSGVFCQSLKMTYKIERPWILDSTLHPVKGALKAASGYSFPSGHTQAATSLFASLAFSIKKLYLKAICVIVFLLVGFSRMYLGVHTFFDVIVSMLVTLLFTVLFFTLLKNIDARENSYIILSLIMAIICLAVLSYASYLYFNKIVPYDLIKDGFKTAGAGFGLAVGYFIENRYVKFSVKCKSIPCQILKLAVGIASALALKAVLKLIFGENIYSDAGRYVLLVVYIVALYPMIIKKFFEVKDTENDG